MTKNMDALLKMKIAVRFKILQLCSRISLVMTSGICMCMYNVCLTQSCCCGYNTHKSWPLLDWSISGASEASIKEMKMQGVLIKLMWFKKLHNSVILTPLVCDGGFVETSFSLQR